MPFVFWADIGLPPSGGRSPYRVIPSPFVQISKGFNVTDDGRIVGTTFQITVKGKLTADKGSPNSTGQFWDTTGYPPDESIASDSRLASIFRKQEALRTLFSAQNQGGKLEFTPWDGTGSMHCNPRITRPVEFAEGNWFNTCDYTVQLEADLLYLNGSVPGSGEDYGDAASYKVSKATEEWNIEAGDERARTWRMTHSVSAQGKLFYSPSGTLDKTPWENARDYVIGKIGLGANLARATATGVLNAGGLKAYNHMRSQHVNELGGGFSVTETWLCYDPGSGIPAMEDFTVNIRTADNGITHVSCEGSVVGFEERSTDWFTLNTARYTNATGQWAAVKPIVFSRCQTISGLTLNPLPLSLTEAHNQYNGTVNYTQEYDNRAVPTIVGAISEVVTLQDHHAADVFASIPVLGRALGPVLQNIGTKTARKRVVQLEIVMPAARIGYSPSVPNTNALVLSLMPVGYSVIFMDSDDETWVARTGRYTRSTSFTWE